MEDERKKKLEKLAELGIFPFKETKFDRKHFAREILDSFKKLEGKKVTVAGRLMSLRKIGKLSFGHLQDVSGKIQLYVRDDELKEYADMITGNLLDVGDIVGVEGTVTKTKTGEISILVKKLTILAKALLPMPEKWHGLKDTEIRYRQRYLDLITNPEIKQIFITRSKIIAALREIMDKKGYIEVQTPILQTIYGGALARPFKTFYNALDTDVFLRIADELYLKRLIVGGFEKVYEVCVDFRNEGLDSMHNPEFYLFEAMTAYTDYNDGMDLIEEIMAYITKKVLGALKIEYQNRKIDLTPPWKRITFYDAIKEHLKIDVAKMDAEELLEFTRKNKIEIVKGAGKGEIIAAIFEELVQDKLIQPTLVYDYPVETSPLAKKKKNNSDIAERFEIFINGAEYGNNYSELNDPEQLRKNFEAQQKRQKEGRGETHPIDEDFIRAISYGMPPTCGIAIGLDRFVMLLTNSASIKDVLLFPHMRPKGEE